MVATAPVPGDWPEQVVRVVKEDLSPGARLDFKMVAGSVKQMIVTFPHIPAGEEAKAIVTIEIRRSTILPPDHTDQYKFADARKLLPGIKQYLAPSPFNECRHPKVIAQAKKIAPEEKKAWDKVEAVYDWTREHVKYENGPLRGALFALNEGRGDCEEITCLFIALCRALDIPARTVHVPDHCYPEFYLVEKVDGKKKGHWFPCQSAGSKAFGGIPETRPILEKGDNFPNPQNRREHCHYLPESVTGAGGKPIVKFIRQLLPEG